MQKTEIIERLEKAIKQFNSDAAPGSWTVRHSADAFDCKIRLACHFTCDPQAWPATHQTMTQEGYAIILSANLGGEDFDVYETTHKTSKGEEFLGSVSFTFTHE